MDCQYSVCEVKLSSTDTQHESKIRWSLALVRVETDKNVYISYFLYKADERCR